MSLSQDLLRELFDYDPLTGVLTWRATGEVAGREDHGYVRVTINRKRYYAHRLIFCWVTGAYPYHVDHENLNGLDNSWLNLRAATKSQNGANRGASVKNKTGVKGVSLCKATGMYRADITVNGKHINLGRRRTLEEAAVLVKEASMHHFGEFARTQ